MILRWFKWSVMRLCSGKLANFASLILSQDWALRSAAWQYSCSGLMYGRLIQYSFSASRSRCFTILRFICHVIGRGRRYFPIHCFPEMPFRSRAIVRNMVALYIWHNKAQVQNISDMYLYYKYIELGGYNSNTCRKLTEKERIELLITVKFVYFTVGWELHSRHWLG